MWGVLMGDYKRIISYIYSYERGRKANNAGFAKIESRNGICKLSMSIRISDILMNETDDNKLEIYLFKRNNKSALEGRNITKIHIGRIKILNGCSNFKLQMDPNDICNSGSKISDINGIFICSKNFLKKNNNVNIIYASEWDDIPIDILDFEELDVKPVVDVKHGDVIYQKSDKEIEFIENINTVEDTHLEVAGYKIDEKPYYNDDEDIKYDNNPYENVNKENDEENKDKVIIDNENIDKECKSEEIKYIEDSSAKDYKEYENKNEDQEAKVNVNNNISQLAPRKFFEGLSKCYPKADVKELEGNCIKITPHDISYLPKRYWHLCNNSFLLHGYNNYRYLVLSECRVGEDFKYRICVPGIFHNREQSVAKLFGFDSFACDGDADTMKFGYWCMSL